MDELNENNAGANLEPVSQNLSDRELFRLKNAEALKEVGTSDRADSSAESNKVADEKQPSPVVKDDEHEGKGFKRRIDTLTSRNKQLEAEYKRMRDEFEAFKAPKAVKKEVDPDMFLDNADYIKALARQNALDALDERESERSKQSIEASQSQKQLADQQKQWNDRVVKSLGDGADDFYQKVEDNMDVVNSLPTDIHDFIDDSPMGVKIMDALLDYPQLVAMLQGIKSPSYRAGKLMEIERAVSNVPAATAKAVTKAPTPIGTVGAVGSAIISDDDLTFRERLLKKQKQRLSGR